MLHGDKGKEERIGILERFCKGREKKLRLRRTRQEERERERVFLFFLDLVFGDFLKKGWGVFIGGVGARACNRLSSHLGVYTLALGGPWWRV